MISTETNRTAELTTDSAETEFDFAFLIHTDTEIQVWYQATGSDYIQLTLDTHYTVVFTESGGTVTTIGGSSPYVAGTILIIRHLAITQKTNWLFNDNHTGPQHEDDFDRAVMRDLQIQEQLDRAVGFAITSSTSGIEFPEPVADNIIGWNADGDALENKVGVTGLTILPPADGNFIVGDGANWIVESDAIARTSLGLGTGDSPTFAGLTVTGTGTFGVLVVDTSTLVVNASGYADRVGIGTAAPGASLHIAKSLGTPTDLGDYNNYQLVIEGGIGMGNTAAILFSSTITSYGGSAIVHYDTGAGGIGDLAFYTKQSTAAEPPVEVMRLDDAGNVGIGTASPQQLLHLSADNATMNEAIRLQNTGSSVGDEIGIYFRHYTDGRLQAFIKDEITSGWPTKLHFGTAAGENSATTKMTIDGSGKVGIGTENPSQKLNIVAGNGGVLISYTGEGIGVAKSLYFGRGGGAWTPIIWGVAGANSDAGLWLLAETEVADDSGTEPLIRLEARQADSTPITTRPLLAIENDGSQLVTVDKDGNVGIGTATPNNLFQVAGLIKFDDTNFNILLGSGVFNNTEGQYNVGIGYRAGYYNDDSGGGTDGTKNVYIGYLAGRGGVGGNTGDTNIAIGDNALRENTSGYENFALGSLALALNTTGIRNIAIGRAALDAGTNGWTVAIGSFALSKATAGYNLALGYKAGGEITSGGGNIAIGANSLDRNQEGVSNTIVGYQAGGLGAGDAQTNLSYHTCIGKDSGYKLANTSASNVFIGYQSGYNQTTGSDLLIIDNQDRGSIAAELTDTLIYGVFSATPASQSLRFNVGTTTWHNATHEDSDGGRASQFNFKGQQSGGEETTLARIEVGHDGAADDEKGFIDGYTNSGSDGDSPTKQFRIQSTGDWVINKTSGIGIKVDLGTPTFGWRDLLGQPTALNTGASKPTFTTYRDTLLQFQFGAGDEEYFEFHIPHDYVAGTDIHLHIHWSHIGTFVTGGTVTFEYEISYAKGHNQAAFPASVGTTFNGTASTTQYQQIITETQISAASPDANQIDSDDLEPDGIIIARFDLNSNDITVSEGAVPDPFIHYVDIHYQSTNIGTKDKVPDFYT